MMIYFRASVFVVDVLRCWDMKMLFLLPVIFSTLPDTATRAQLFDPYAYQFGRAASLYGAYNPALLNGMFGTTAGMGHAYGGMGGHYGGYNPLAAASLMDPYSTGGMMNAAMMTGGYGGASTAAGLNGLNAFNPLVHGTGINPYSFMFNNNNGNGLNGLLGDGGYGGGFTTSSNNGFNGPSPNFIHTGSSGRQFRRHDRHYGGLLPRGDREVDVISTVSRPIPLSYGGGGGCAYSKRGCNENTDKE